MSEQTTAGARRFGCPSCGGGLRYEIRAQALKCDMCERIWKLSDLPDDETDAGSGSVEVTAYQCPQCGAMLASGTTELTSFCSFCGSDVVLTQRVAQMRRPDLILPFRITREGCESAYRNFLREHRFAPSNLKKQETVGHFRPVYIPFWAYDVTMNGRRHYIIRQIKSDVEETRRVEVELDYEHRGILFDASAAFEDETAARLAHSVRDAVPFHAGYLSGMYAQMADVGSEVYENEARASASLSCAKHVMQKLSCTEIRFPETLSDQDAEEAQVSAKLVLLPVWLLAKKSGSRVLYTAVNGTNGNVVCDPPLSWVKVGALTLAIIAALFFLLYIAGTLALHHLMVATAAVMLATLRLMVPVYRDRLFRERREGEPDFSKPSRHVGEMQSRLRESLGMNARGMVPRKDGGKVAKGVFSVLGLILSILIRAGLRAFIAIFALAVTWLASQAYVLSLVLVAAYWVLSAVRFGRMIARLPGRAEESAFLSAVGVVHLLAAVMIALAIIQPARDLIYYIIIVASLAATACIQVLMIARQNRFATRPVPFYEGEGEP